MGESIDRNVCLLSLFCLSERLLFSAVVFAVFSPNRRARGESDQPVRGEFSCGAGGKGAPGLYDSVSRGEGRGRRQEPRRGSAVVLGVSAVLPYLVVFLPGHLEGAYMLQQ